MVVNKFQRGEESTFKEGNGENYEKCVEIVRLEQVIGGWLEGGFAVGLKVYKKCIRDNSQYKKHNSNMFFLSFEVFDSF